MTKLPMFASVAALALLAGCQSEQTANNPAGQVPNLWAGTTCVFR